MQKFSNLILICSANIVKYFLSRVGNWANRTEGPNPISDKTDIILYF